jgi:hypothetical protein
MVQMLRNLFLFTFEPGLWMASKLARIFDADNEKTGLEGQSIPKCADALAIILLPGAFAFYVRELVLAETILSHRS